MANHHLFAQQGSVYETYKSRNDSTNSSHGSIFPKAFQEYNYIKTPRGIEVYETYKNYSGNTNQSSGTIFSKPFPSYIIINDKIYRTYVNRPSSTNVSGGTIFTKPFEAKVIDPSVKNIRDIYSTSNSIINNDIKYTKSISTGPTYDGETFSEGGN